MLKDNIPALANLEVDIETMSKQDIRDLIHSIEEKALAPKAEEHQIDVPIKHHFSKDVYAREMIVPKGSLIIGKIHKYANLNILSSGEVSILSIDGVVRVKAPFTIVASPGSKRLFFAHEDSVWTTIHGTAEKDVDKIEDHFIAKNYDELPLPVGEVLISMKEN
jgi:hypothetical protein